MYHWILNKNCFWRTLNSKSYFLICAKQRFWTNQRTACQHYFWTWKICSYCGKTIQSTGWSHFLRRWKSCPYCSEGFQLIKELYAHTTLEHEQFVPILAKVSNIYMSGIAQSAPLTHNKNCYWRTLNSKSYFLICVFWIWIGGNWL